jgi:hypothetical protein
MKPVLNKDSYCYQKLPHMAVSIMKNLIIVIPVIAFAWSCYYDNEEFLYPKLSNSCDTIDVTFSSAVKPVLQQYCFTCHSNSNAAPFGGNIKLEDYADVKISADNGKLYGTVAHLPGYSAMPKGGSKLDDCDISMIKSWIDSGAPDN